MLSMICRVTYPYIWPLLKKKEECASKHAELQQWALLQGRGVFTRAWLSVPKIAVLLILLPKLVSKWRPIKTPRHSALYTVWHSSSKSLGRYHTFALFQEIFSSKLHDLIHLETTRLNRTWHCYKQHGFFMNKTDVVRVVAQCEVWSACWMQWFINSLKPIWFINIVINNWHTSWYSLDRWGLVGEMQTADTTRRHLHLEWSICLRTIGLNLLESFTISSHHRCWSLKSRDQKMHHNLAL